jgi:hypothetical protein
MSRWLTALLAALTVCPAIAGCLHQAGFYGSCSANATAGTPCDTLPAMERGRLDIQGEARMEAVAAPARRFAYRGVTPEQCQCLAVQNAGTANMLDSERQGVAIQAARLGRLHSHQESELAETKATILFHAAREIRNRNAGTALEVYYHLAEAEAKSDLAEQSADILRDLSVKFQEMKTKGLQLPIDYKSLTRKQLDAQIQQTQVQLAIEELNGELIQLLGLNGCAPDEHVWPAADFKIVSQTLDIEAAVSQGLAQRPELVLLHEVQQTLSAGTLSAVRPLAESFNPLLGMMDQRPPSLFAVVLLRRLLGNQPELEVRRQQLQEHHAERQKAVAEEIRQAARTLIAQQRLAALTYQKVQSWETGVRELEDRNRQGLASSTEVAMAKLDWLRARGDLVKEVMAWHIARAKLKQAQGVLASECGDYNRACP